MLGKSNYSPEELEIEKRTIERELIETQNAQTETLVEFSHKSVYKDHAMGRPILGNLENIYNVNQKMVLDYHDSLYYGKNMAIVAMGNIENDYLIDQCNKYFGIFPENPKKQPVFIFL